MKRTGRTTKYLRWTALFLAAVMITGCSTAEGGWFKNDKWADEMYEQALVRSKESRFQTPAEGVSSPGTDLRENDKVCFDCSCVSDGYVLVRLKGANLRKIKLQVSCGEDVCTYTVTPGREEVFPLACGSGEYKISAFENVEGTKYALVLSETMNVEIKDEFSPFLRPNQYVNYSEAPVTRALAEIISEQESELLSRVDLTFRFVLARMSYDRELAQTVKDGYVPELDADLERGKGICFDYAALMAAMLRSMKIPCRLVTGYAGSAFHAWISVWSEDEGWLDKVIYFDGKGWQRADPTFADSDASSGKIQEYIGDGSNYVEKHYY